MKIERKELKTIDGKDILQVTTEDERFYLVDGVYVPSVTWIASYYPKGSAYVRWVAEHGYSEAELIKQEAATKGSKVHQAVTDILNGLEVKHDAKYMNNEKDVLEELTAVEYGAVMDFTEWLNETQPELLAVDYTIVGDGYAGTVDFKVRIKGEVWIVDLKTSQDIWPSHELQVSAYKHADSRTEPVEEKVDRIAILQVGYRRNKIKHYKFTEIEDQFSLFLDVKNIWAKETAGQQPSQKDFPLSLAWKKPVEIANLEIPKDINKPVKVVKRKLKKKHV